MKQPRAFVIAGPNGSGKTTFAREFLSTEAACPIFLNADLIAAGLSPLHPEAANTKAMRLMAEQMRACVEARRDFAVESTLAGRTYVSLMRGWRAAGYRVKIIYLWLDAVELAIGRVRFRVAEGGHNVPEEVIKRRSPKAGRISISCIVPSRTSGKSTTVADRFPCCYRKVNANDQADRRELRHGRITRGDVPRRSSCLRIG